jgi:hypothetical protein
VIDETVSPVSVPAGSSYANYDTGELDLAQTYYWKINEVNEAETPTTWKGDVWNFSTQEYLVVDDFEDYNDFEPDRIFDTWIDGWNVPANGSQVGYTGAPFCERTIIHGGKQSMPLFYSNTSGTVYSEAERTFTVGQDWTRAGATLLAVHFYGDPNNALGQFYVKVNGVKVPYDGDSAALTMASWTRWDIDLSAVGTNLEHITSMAIGIEGSGSGIFYIDDIWLLSPSPVPPGAGLVHHWTLDADGTDSVGGLHGTVKGAVVVPGKIGNGLLFDGQNDSVDFTGFVPPLQGTIALWMNAASVGPRGRFLGSVDQFEAYIQDGGCSPTSFFPQAVRRTISPAVPYSWKIPGYHVALTYNGLSNLQQIYINGQLDAEGMTADDLWGGGDFAFGHRAGQSKNFYNGILDDVRYYDKVLTAEEVRQLMN